MVRLCLLLVLFAACGHERSRTPAESPDLPATPVEPDDAARAQSAKVDAAWHDFDDLPAGAIARLGSQRMRSSSATVAIRDDGTLALLDDDLGLIEIRADGRYRVIVGGDGCGGSDGLVRYVGSELRAHCDKTVYTVRGDVVSSAPSPCTYGKRALAPSGEYLACVDSNQLYLLRWPNTVLWKIPMPDDQRALHVSDAGDVIVVESERVRVFRDGAVTWSKPWNLEWSGFETELVGWDDGARAIVRIALADGAVVSRTALPGYSIEREIAIAPGGRSYFVSLYGTYPGDKPDTAETFRAHVGASGKLLGTWRGPDYEWGNAVSPNGKLAASVGVGRVMRVHLDDPSVPADRGGDGERPDLVAISADGRTVAAATQSFSDQKLALFDVASGARRAQVAAPEYATGMALSPDGKRVAVAGQFGDFAIYDASTGAMQCTAKDSIPGSTIWWRGSHLVAYFPGDNGDDCDEITEGSITVADDRCRVIKHHEVYGMVELLDASADRTTVAMAAWKNECGAGYDLKPWKAFAIDHKTGAKIATPKRDGDWSRREKAAEAARDGAESPEAAAIAEGSTLVSADGKTRLTWESEDDKSFLRCADIASGKTIVRHPLPSGIGEPFAIAGDGRFSVATDRGSLVLYACRATKISVGRAP